MKEYIYNVLVSTGVLPFKWRGSKYSCFFCQQFFTEASKLRYHTKNEHKKYPYMDTITRYVDQRLQVKIDITDLRCLKCEHTTNTFDELLTHLMTHGLVKDVQANLFVAFELRDEWMKCLHCSERFQFFGTLFYHLNKEHGEGSKRVCDQCGRHSFSEFSFSQHMKTYHLQNEFKCRHCSEVFNIETKRKAHEYKKHDIKTYRCYKCTEYFGTTYLRKIHLSEAHQCEKFTCNKCPMAYIHMSLLRKHYKRAHDELTHESDGRNSKAQLKNGAKRKSDKIH